MTCELRLFIGTEDDVTTDQMGIRALAACAESSLGILAVPTFGIYLGSSVLNVDLLKMDVLACYRFSVAAGV